MPYENDKENRSGGKKAVTRKSDSSASGERRTQTSKSQSAKSKSAGTSSGRKSTASSAAQPKKRPSGSTSSDSTRKAESARSRENSSAREDYRRFSEDIKARSKSERSAPAKKPQRPAQRSGKDAKKGKSQSRSKLTSVLTYLMIIFAFAALMVTLSMTVFFKTDSIKVVIDGRKYYSEERIIEASEVEIGENIFSIDLEKTEEKIESELPYVGRCEIRRALPTGIKINIISAEPAGVVTLKTGARIIISTEGKCLEKLNPLSGNAVSATDIENTASATDISSTDIPLQHPSYYSDHSAYTDEASLPEIVGLVVFGGTEPGEYIDIEDETAMATLAQLTELLVKYDLPPDKIDLSAGNLYAYYDNRIMIKLGSGADLEAKIQLAGEIILNRLSEYDSGRVDVSNVKVGYFTPEYMLD